MEQGVEGGTMNYRMAVCAGLLILTIPSLAIAKKKDELSITSQHVPGVTRLLEEQPLSPEAPALRALMLQWEDNSEDSIDVVCGEVLGPILVNGTPNGPQLMAQFIFGSAASQIVDPSQKDQIQPNQLAGMRSMLKAYANFLAADAGNRVPYLDEWTAAEASGELPAKLEPLAAKCATSV
jgi:hypothetical protein